MCQTNVVENKVQRESRYRSRFETGNPVSTGLVFETWITRLRDWTFLFFGGDFFSLSRIAFVISVAIDSLVSKMYHLKCNLGSGNMKPPYFRNKVVNRSIGLLLPIQSSTAQTDRRDIHNKSWIIELFERWGNVFISKVVK